MFSARSCRSSICLCRLSIAWLVSLVVFSCHYGLREVHRSSLFEAFYVPCPGPFHCSHIAVISVICPLPDQDVGLRILVCDVEHTSFHSGMCGSEFVRCLFGQCPGLCTMCHSWQHTGVVHLSLKEMARSLVNISRCLAYAPHPACHDYSLYRFVLVLFLDTGRLSQVYV